MKGHCLCKQTRFEIHGEITACVNCHCDSCRRQCAAPMTTYIGVNDGDWSWVSDVPKTFNSSPGVTRFFCETCGSPIAYRSTAMADIMHFYVASMEDPSALAPTLHVANEERLPWLQLADDLPVCIGPDYTKAEQSQ